jgi:hypothetical protein
VRHVTYSEHAFTRYADIVAALADPLLVPAPVEPGPVGTVAWLRASVARFSSGEEHARRRARVEAELARLDPVELRGAAGGGDAAAAVVRALATAMGMARPDAVAEAVGVAAGAYFGGGGPAEDAAVARLVDLCGPEPETAAHRIGLLVQACDATGGLVDRALARGESPGEPTMTWLEETLRHEPPVRALRRTAVGDTRVAGVVVARGDLVLLDVVVANADPEAGGDHLTFGAGPRICPGREHAMALAAGLLERRPGRELADGITGMVAHVLRLASTWTHWDGRPFPVDDRVYTPHKAIRRVADHLVDHLAELEARLAGEEPQPDHWHASATTTPSDLAAFTQEDLEEARSRLTRLARIWANRLEALTAAQLDDSPGTGWTFREIATHLTGSVYYADSVGDLTPAATPAKEQTP